MREADFNKICRGNFEPNPKLRALEDTFDSYYRNHLSDTDARILWSDLRRYARNLGFTNRQFQNAKLRAIGRIKIADRR